MKTSIYIDARLIEEVVHLTGERTEAAGAEVALREYARLRRKKLLLSLPDSIRLEENWRELRDLEV